jgi:hypothetical protein
VRMAESILVAKNSINQEHERTSRYRNTATQ